MNQSWARDTRAGIGWSVGTFAAGRVFTFVATLILARLLVPAEFGVVAAILAYTSLLELGSDLGMQATVVYEQEKGHSDRLHNAFTINLGIACAFSFAGVLFAPLVASFFGSAGDVGLFRLAALSLLLTGLGNIHDGLLLRELDFRRRVVPELTKGTVRGVVSIALALAGAGAASLVVGLLAGQAAWVIVLWAITAYRPRLRFDRATARSMTAYGTGAVMLEVLGVVATRADVVVIGKVLGVAALGIYTVAFRVPDVLIQSVTWSVSKVVFPALSRVRASDREALPAATLTLLRYQALGALPVAATLAVLSSPLIVVLFSEKWAAGGGVMAAVAVATGIGAMAYPLGDVFKALGRQRTLVAVNLVNLPLMVAGMIVVAPSGIVWVAWAIAGLATLNLLIIAGLVSRTLGIRVRQYLVAILPAVATAAGCGLAAAFVRVAGSSAPRGVVVFTGLCAAAAGGVAAMRLLAPETFTALLGIVRTLRSRRAQRRRQVKPSSGIAPPAAPRHRTSVPGPADGRL
jgi:lipopolysaccharide exporter